LNGKITGKFGAITRQILLQCKVHAKIKRKKKKTSGLPKQYQCKHLIPLLSCRH